jgi:hypothetical protein
MWRRYPVLRVLLLSAKSPRYDFPSHRSQWWSEGLALPLLTSVKSNPTKTLAPNVSFPLAGNSATIITRALEPHQGADQPNPFVGGDTALACDPPFQNPLTAQSVLPTDQNPAALLPRRFHPNYLPPLPLSFVLARRRPSVPFGLSAPPLGPALPPGNSRRRFSVPPFSLGCSLFGTPCRALLLPPVYHRPHPTPQ